MAKPATRNLLDFLRILLRPAMAFCLRRGLKIQDLHEAAKAVFIEMASAELKLGGQEANISRLGAATGIHRRDVMRLTDDAPETSEPKGLINRLIGQWQYDQRFLDKNKKPKLLSFAGENSEFYELVRSITNDLHPTTLLSEMERTGLVKRTEKGLKLLKMTFAVTGAGKDASRMLARDLSFLAAAVEDNLETRKETPHLHATTDFDNIRLDKLPEIQNWLLKEGSKFQKHVRDYLAQHDLDFSPTCLMQGGGRVVLSTFSYTQEPKP